MFALSFVPQIDSVDEAAAYELLHDALFKGIKWDTSVNTLSGQWLGKAVKAIRFTCDDRGDTSKAHVHLTELVQLICNEMTMTLDNTFLAGYRTSRMSVS